MCILDNNVQRSMVYWSILRNDLFFIFFFFWENIIDVISEVCTSYYVLYNCGRKNNDSEYKCSFCVCVIKRCGTVNSFLDGLIFCCNAALRTTRGSPYVHMSVCPSVSFSFFAIYSKNLQVTHTSKFVILCNIFLRMPLWKKNFKNLVYEGVQHFLDTKYKIIFLL